MPVVNFHLVEGYATHDQIEALLVGGSEIYARVFDSPIERVRAMITMRAPTHFAVGGKTSARADTHAPFFEMIAMAGRQDAQIQAGIEALTGLLVEVLGVDRAVVRGACWRVPPEDWGIAGVPASVTRQAEITARAAAAAL